MYYYAKTERSGEGESRFETSEQIRTELEKAIDHIEELDNHRAEYVAYTERLKMIHAQALANESRERK